MISLTLKKAPLFRLKRRQRGATLLLFTFLITLVVIPLIGLAIDGAVVFWVKAKLSSAVDAAALAAGRSINAYYTQQQNSGPVVSVAQQWFDANFPAGWLGTSVVGGQPTVTIQPTGYMTQQVSVQAQAVVPLFFMRLMHFNSITVLASAQSSRRNLNIVLVLDRSGSMGPAGSNACPTMIAASQNFTDRFTDGFDTIGLVTFSSTANNNPIDYAPTTHFKTGNPTLNSVIGQIYCTGATGAAQALNVAYQSIQSTGLAGALNVIVFFTDGQPNEVVSNSWPIRTTQDGTDNRYDPVNYNSLTLPPPSTCTLPQTISGGLTTMLASGTSPQTTGYTGGILDTSTNVAINSSAGYVNAPGCGFTNTSGSSCYQWQPTICVRQDIAYIPSQDAYRNSTIGYKSVDTFPSSNTQNAGQIRDDEQVPAVIAAALNAADNQAKTIRNDTTYNTVIYTIGLGGAPDMPIDQVFLQRVANDPQSPIYDSSRPAGYFAYAADPSALNQAFTMIASQILRLSQ